eukprot:1282891-Pyramimonas_sp.AAC.1
MHLKASSVVSNRHLRRHTSAVLLTGTFRAVCFVQTSVPVPLRQGTPPQTGNPASYREPRLRQGTPPHTGHSASDRKPRFIQGTPPQTGNPASAAGVVDRARVHAVSVDGRAPR